MSVGVIRIFPWTVVDERGEERAEGEDFVAQMFLGSGQGKETGERNRERKMQEKSLARKRG